MAEEKYQNKYNFNCEPGSYPTFIQDSVFNISGDFVTTPVKRKPSEENNHVDNEEFPPCLATDKAMNYWKELKDAGFVDENCQLCEGVSRKTAMYIADSMADALGLAHRWKPFKQLWKMNNLAQEKTKMHDIGKLPKGHEDIDRIFND